MTSIESILKGAYDTSLVDKLLTSYKEIEESYVLGRWKPSELNAGHFVECIRRILELELFSTFIPFRQSLNRFNDVELKRYETGSGHDSFRLLIPRILKSVFNIRNKRGVAHIGDINPNEMDSTYILHSVKWVLAEIVRLKSQLSIQGTQKILNEITEHHIELLWKENGIKRVLDSKIRTKDQILIVLLDSSPQKVTELQKITEYQNNVNFRKVILHKLHKERLIELDNDTQDCFLSPIGKSKAEKLILKYLNLNSNGRQS